MLLRLTPLPFSIVSYFLGLTKVKIRDYLIGTSITCTYIALWLYIGQSFLRFSEVNQKLKQKATLTEQLKSSESTIDAQLEFFLLAFEIIIAFGVGIIISYKAKLELDKKIEQSRIQDEERQSVIKGAA